jgi:ankyrin repeat protein
MDGITALIQAAKMGHVDTIKLLLERGETVDFETTSGATALIAASLEGQVDSMVGRCGAA